MSGWGRLNNGRLASDYHPLMEPLITGYLRRQAVTILYSRVDLDKRGVDAVATTKWHDPTIGLRVRSPGCSGREITLRSMSHWRRDRVELANIKAGWCQLFAYGVAAPGRRLRLASMVLIDLNGVREALRKRPTLGFDLPNKDRRTGVEDGTAFLVLGLDDLPEWCILSNPGVNWNPSLPGMAAR